MLNTFYHRSCFEFTAEMDFTAPCQSFVDLGLIFAAALGAGVALWDERVAVLGFIVVHVLASVLFVLALVMPSLLGLTDPPVFDAILQRTLVVALRSQFPLAIIFSLVGSLLGLYFGGKLEAVLVPGRPAGLG